MQKAKEKYSKEKAAEYYARNKEPMKEKSKEHYKNLSQEKKHKIKDYQGKKYQELVQYKKEALKHKYLEAGIVKPLCIILPRMSGYIKYFENGSKNMSFLIKDDEVWDKYDKIWDVIKDKLGIKFHSEPVYEYKYLKAKVREFDGVIKTNFLGNDMPKENMHYTCITCITIDSVMRIDKKNHPQVYLEECKYKTKKIQMP